MRFSNMREQQIVHVRNTTCTQKIRSFKNTISISLFWLFFYFTFYVFLFLFTHLYYFVRNYKHKHIFIVQKFNFQYPLTSRLFQILVTIKFPDNAFTPVSQTSSIPQPQIFFILFSLKFIAKLTLVSQISSFSKVQQLNN